MEGNREKFYTTVQDYNIVLVVSLMDYYSEEKKIQPEKSLLNGTLNFFFFAFIFLLGCCLFFFLWRNPKSHINHFKILQVLQQIAEIFQHLKHKNKHHWYL